VDLAARYTELDTAAGLVRDIHQELSTEKAKVQEQVDRLTSSGWRGPAASAYAAAWRDWVGAADRILDALQAESRLITEFRAGLQSTDSGVTTSMSGLQSRLGPQ
jgi:WXG100 family type VII secretion target